MTTAMLTPEFYARYNALPQRPFHDVLAWALRIEMALVGFRVDVEGDLPARPSLLCTNSTQKYDFLALMRGLDQRGHRVVTLTKAKNYHSAAMAFVMKRAGVVPLASRGYFILADFLAVHGRRPTDAEYRALRTHVDNGAPIEDVEPFASILQNERAIAGHAFDPGTGTWRDAIERVYQAGLAETTRLARDAVDAGYHVQIYPEGTVNPRLGVCRDGAKHLAKALGLDMVPVGMSGCPRAFLGPLPKRGRIRIRIGKRLESPENLGLALAALVDDEYKPGEIVAKGTRALL